MEWQHISMKWTWLGAMAELKVSKSPRLSSVISKGPLVHRTAYKQILHFLKVNITSKNTKILWNTLRERRWRFLVIIKLTCRQVIHPPNIICITRSHCSALLIDDRGLRGRTTRLHKSRGQTKGRKALTYQSKVAKPLNWIVPRLLTIENNICYDYDRTLVTNCLNGLIKPKITTDQLMQSCLSSKTSLSFLQQMNRRIYCANQ